MEFTFDEKKHVYLLDGKPMMGVTSVLGIIAKPALIGWASKMACEYVRENLKSLDELEQVLTLAKDAHRRKKEERGAGGKDTHALIEEYVKERIANSGHAKLVESDNIGLVAFAQWAVDNDVTFLGSEVRMYSEEWWVAGTCDLVLEMGGKTYIADVKTQAKLWDNTPHVQCAAYAKMWMERGRAIDGTLVIILPQGNPPVTTHVRYDLENDIKAFESALRLYKAIPL